MGDGTGIEWTEATWNPIAGCSIASPGCEHCYAAREAAGRLSGHPVYAGLAVRPEGGGPAAFTGEVRLLPERLDQPLRWRRSRLIFVNSMSDLFHPEVPTEFIARVVAVMAQAYGHTFQVLTKRPRRMAALVSSFAFWNQVADVLGDESTLRLLQWEGNGVAVLPNVWWGTSIESNRYAWRADALRDMPAAVRWVSAEPLLGPLDQLDLTGIDWVVAGGESGPGARPMHVQWVRELNERCHEAARSAAVEAVDGRHGYTYEFSHSPEAHLAEYDEEQERRRPKFLFKQWGEWAPTLPAGLPASAGTHLLLNDGTLVSDDERLGMRHIQGPVLVARFGKRKAGRELDGRTWDEYPVAR